MRHRPSSRSAWCTGDVTAPPISTAAMSRNIVVHLSGRREAHSGGCRPHPASPGRGISGLALPYGARQPPADGRGLCWGTFLRVASLGDGDLDAVATVLTAARRLTPVVGVQVHFSSMTFRMNSMDSSCENANVLMASQAASSSATSSRLLVT